jgi:hypothetical protein
MALEDTNWGYFIPEEKPSEIFITINSTKDEENR